MLIPETHGTDQSPVEYAPFRLEEKIERINAIGRTAVVLIHGLWLTAQTFVKRFVR